MKNTVQDLIDYLKILPPDAKVEVLEVRFDGFYEVANFMPLDLSVHYGRHFYKELNILSLGEKY